jgi:hypothetical protein
MTTSLSNAEPMPPRRIPSILAVGVLFLALGVLDVYRGIAPLFGTASRLATDDMQVLAIGIAALVGGTFVLRGQNWARWLLAIWMLLHVVISMGHPGQLIAHAVIFGYLTFLLFRPRASAYFSPAAAAGP